jgi:hypothetical protein
VKPPGRRSGPEGGGNRPAYPSRQPDSDSPILAYHLVVSRLDGVRQRGVDRAQALCPAHDDRVPSLSVTAIPGWGVLIHCHAGCRTDDVVDELGLTTQDLFDKRTPAKRRDAGMRPPDPAVAELLPNPRRFGKVYVDTISRVSDTTCLAIYSVLAIGGPKGVRLAMAEVARMARVSETTAREHLWHLVADGLVESHRGGHGRGDYPTWTVRHPEPQTVTTAYDTWSPARRVNRKGVKNRTLIEPRGQAGYREPDPYASERVRNPASKGPESGTLLDRKTGSDLHKHTPDSLYVISTGEPPRPRSGDDSYAKALALLRTELGAEVISDTESRIA